MKEGWIHAGWLEKQQCKICKDMIFVREVPMTFAKSTIENATASEPLHTCPKCGSSALETSIIEKLRAAENKQ